MSNTSDEYSNLYTYAEIAVGGANRRGTVCKVADVETHAEHIDHYLSLLRFGFDFREYAENNLSPKTGKPSAAGFPGKAWTDRFVADFDDETDPERARSAAVTYVEWLIDHGVNPAAVRAWYSGHKGFHIEIPAACFGGFDPAENIAGRQKALAYRLLSNIPTWDPAIYDKTRLWRTPNTKNRKSGRYKIPLTVAELFSLSLDQIRALAGSPRHLDLPDVPSTPIPALVELWEETEDAVDQAKDREPLDTEAILDGVPRGQRDEKIFRLACKLRNAGVPYGTAEELVLRAAAGCFDPDTGASDPFPEDEARTKVRNAYARYEAGFPFTELGNAEVFATQHKGTVRYFDREHTWYVKRGAIYRPDNAAVERLVRETVRSRKAEAERISNKTAKREALRFVKGSESAARLGATERLARAEPGIPVSADEMDQDPWLFAVDNGVLHLRTQRLVDVPSAAVITRQAAVRYDPTATCPVWEGTVRAVFGGNEELADFFQRCIGYSMTGDQDEQKIFIAHGYGANGKSTLLNTVRRLCGDYGATTPFDTFDADRKGTIPNDLAALRGIRFVLASESEAQRRLAEARVKAVTGGDQITARFLHKEWFSFSPQFHVWLMTNHRPVIRGSDYGIWRRVVLFPFDEQFSGNRADKSLGRRVLGELPGILNWCLEGVKKWQAVGLAEPDIIAKASAGYREEMDIIGAFLEERCVASTGAKVEGGALYPDYHDWCKSNGEYALSRSSFGRELSRRGYTPLKSGGKNWWKGLKLREMVVRAEAFMHGFEAEA